MTELFNVQLIRPFWLLGLVPVALLIWMAWQLKNRQGAWHKIIAPEFRALLLGESTDQVNQSTNQWPLIGLATIWIILVIALSGPSLKTVELPAEKNNQGVVVVLDLSLSMLADDITPNRLSRIKYTLTDLLTQHPELSVGLVAYAQTAHTITPISEDNQTLLEMLPNLNPIIMPAYGSEPLKGFVQAKKLLEGAHINQGHIIWITDDIELQQVEEIQNWIKRNDDSVSILTIGTPQGGAVQIPDYGLLKDDENKVVMPGLPIERFNSFTHLDRVTLTQFDVLNDDITSLLPPIAANKKDDKPAEQKIRHPLDEGAWLILILLPFIALGYRRGWFFVITSINVLPLAGFMAMATLGLVLHPMPVQAQAQTQTHVETETNLPDFIEVFKSSNQQGYQAWQQHNYQNAADLFDDPQWQASAQYRLGQYAQSALLFSQDKSAQGLFNRANALAKSGEFVSAKEAYENALEQLPNPTLLKSIQHNLSLIQTLIEQTEAKQKADNQVGQPSQKSPEQSKHKNNPPSDSPNKSKTPQPSTNQNTQQQEPKNNPPSTEASADKNEGRTPQDSANASTNPDKQSLHSEGLPSPKKTELSKGQTDTDLEVDPNLPDSHNQADAQLNPAHNTDKKPGKTKINTPLTPQEKETQQATQNWLKQIPDQPGLFLKRKFEYQFQQQNHANESSPNGRKQW